MSQYIPHDWPFERLHPSDQEDRIDADTVILLGHNGVRKRIRVFKGLKKGLLMDKKIEHAQRG